MTKTRLWSYLPGFVKDRLYYRCSPYVCMDGETTDAEVFAAFRASSKKAF